MTKSRCMNRELTIELIVGTFMASVVIVLVVFTIVISAGRLGGGRQSLEIKFDQVMGLRRHDNVLIRGMPVGTVRDLHLGPDYVLVSLVLHQPVILRQGYRFRVEPSSILGGSHLVVEPGDGEVLSEDTILWGDQPRDLMADLSELALSIRKSLVDEGILDNIRDTSSSLAEITGRIERGEGAIGKLVSAEDDLYDDLRATVAGLRQTTDRIARGEGLLGRLITAEDGMYDDLRDTAAAARVMAERLKNGQGTLGRLISEDDQLYHEVVATARNLNAITTRLEQGQGTLGKLLAEDDQLYRDLAGLVENAREAFDDLRETTPIVTFSSMLFGAF